MENNYNLIAIKTIVSNAAITMYPTVLKYGEQFLLVDTGSKGSLDEIENALKKLDLSLTNCYGIIITHHDYDHMGSAHEILEKYPHIKILASQKEKEYIEGSLPSPRLAFAKKLISSGSDARITRGKTLFDSFSTQNHVMVDEILTENKVYPWAGGTKVIPTPGHTDGHISLHIIKDDVVITGDALVCPAGIDSLDISPPQTLNSLPTSIASVQRIKDLHPEKLHCIHGGLIEDKVDQRIDVVINHYNS